MSESLLPVVDRRGISMAQSVKNAKWTRGFSAQYSRQRRQK